MESSAQPTTSVLSEEVTIEVFGYSADDFMDGIEPVCGAAHFIEDAADADVPIFV